MKAIRLNEWGKALVLEDVSQPVPNENEILIRVRAASINPFDSAVQAGYLQGMAQIPLTLGTDFAGEVVTVGDKLDHFKPGDEVYGLVVLGAGAFAEYTIAGPHQVALKPRSLDFVTAAGVPLPAMAAWKSLYELLQIQPGERLLIHGAAGNVGGLAVQLAKAEGLFVYGADVPQKAEHAKMLGVDQFISNEDRFEDAVSDVDAVLDLVGGELMQRSYTVIKPGGRYVTSLVAETPQEEPQRLGIRSLGLAAWPDASVLKQIAQRIDSGKLKVFVNRTFPLEDANAAMIYRMQSTAPGKVVLTVM